VLTDSTSTVTMATKTDCLLRIPVLTVSKIISIQFVHRLTWKNSELDLPEYESYDHLRSQIMKAITAGSEYFGFAWSSIFALQARKGKGIIDGDTNGKESWCLLRYPVLCFISLDSRFHGLEHWM
jgi:hypothetical protein